MLQSGTSHASKAKARRPQSQAVGAQLVPGFVTPLAQTFGLQCGKKLSIAALSQQLPRLLVLFIGMSG
jgi:hypothetical protein